MRYQLKTNRHGFTLMELLVVIGIIAFLMSSFVLVLANYLSLARAQQTQFLLRNIDNTLQTRISAMSNQVDPSTSTSDPALQIIALKNNYRKSFPQNVWSPSTAIEVDTKAAPYSVVRQWIENAPAGAERNRRLKCESSACLYLTLTQGRTFGTPTANEVDFSPSQYVEELDASNSNAPIRYFVDVWGEPLRFYRNPTRLFWLGEDINGNGTLQSNEDFDNNGSLTQPSATELALMAEARSILVPDVRLSPLGAVVNPFQVDSDDPLNRLTVRWKNLNDPSNTGTEDNHRAEFLFHTPSTFSVPLIISAGPDRMLGLEEPLSTDGNNAASAAKRRLMVSDINALYDNVTNLNTSSRGGN